METEMNLQPQPHVLLFPFPVQGHIKPMLTLAQLLCHSGIHVTFVNTEHNHLLLTQREALSARFPTLHFHSISDGLPSDHPRSLNPYFIDIVTSLRSKTGPLLHQLLVSLTSKTDVDSAADQLPPLSCVITDGLMCFAIDAADKVGIQVIAVRTSSACSVWCYLCVPKLIEEGQAPFGDEESDKMVLGVPGMEYILRRRDLPSICRAPTNHTVRQFFVEEHIAITRASGLILNTFDELESSVLSHIASKFPKIYAIGPLHALLQSRVGDDDLSSSSAAAASLRREDRRCMMWLDSQEAGSVIFVSYGSLVKLTRVQLLEFWHGLVNSGSPFLWVIRSDVLHSTEVEHANRVTPVELEMGTKERGFIVDWAPQEEVLAHEAVGGFLTHSGWNSTLQAIWAGVPMLCWPQLADQQVNSRWVGEVWKIGVDMKDTCDRATVETMIKALMHGEEREVISRAVDQYAKSARTSVGEAGSSYHNLETLISDLRTLVI
ncbi:7-deoxyloganetic acid glucosyltransferase-like [Argentina anserina]|uniref:7-deoxyloganetic acid glucosyltransferase-like n=1 Tax=Argentina anserina TaxID=57926 RepID=UPI0021768245|nr:7-deoxyloganetic acid glucosyltransferase-like [Potentilla anserina]